MIVRIRRVTEKDEERKKEKEDNLTSEREEGDKKERNLEAKDGFLKQQGGVEREEGKEGKT